jgi:uncharacterized protein (DUF58 family)
VFAYLEKMVQSFADRRYKKAVEHHLSRTNLFIFPNLRGISFAFILAAMWVLGTNYQNNLILAAAFFLASIYVVGILKTFSNLAQLNIRYSGCSECFAGDDMLMHFRVNNFKRTWSESVSFRWDSDGAVAARMSFAALSESGELIVALPCPKRGRVHPPKMLIECVYPLGIIRCWTWLKWDINSVVYPKALKAPLGSAMVADDDGDGLHPVKGGDDFQGLKTYIPGDSLKRIAWKAYAREQGLHAKDFSQSLSQELWLDYDSLTQYQPEERLSILCFWVMHFYYENENYGLSLPSIEISPATGEHHRRSCLNALALFGEPT